MNARMAAAAQTKQYVGVALSLDIPNGASIAAAANSDAANASAHTVFLRRLPAKESLRKSVDNTIPAITMDAPAPDFSGQT